MANPVIAQEVLPIAAGITGATLMTSLPPHVVIGSFAGATLFLLGVKEKPKYQWVLLFNIAFFCGLIAGPTAAAILSQVLAMLHLTITIPQALGSTIAAACTVNMINWLRDNPTFFTKKDKDQ